jgi:ribulose-phosphate 3-epimerase
MEIIPAILEKNFSEIEKKIKKLESYFKKVQIDFGDGLFVKEKSGDIENFKKISTNIDIEAHIMVEKPWTVIDRLKELGFKRITFHYESFLEVKKKTRGFAINNLIKGIQGIRGTQGITLRQGSGQEGKIEVGIAINPETDPSHIVDFLPRIDEVLLLAVNPGKKGQSFQPDVLTKINFLKNFRKDLIVGVDGGVNDASVKTIIGAGADKVYVNSFLWKEKSLEDAIKKIQIMI